MKNNKSNVIQFPVKATSHELITKVEYAQIQDRASKLAVLTGYLGAREGHTQNQVMNMMTAELDSRGLAYGDRSTMFKHVEIGFSIFQKKPNLSSEEVYSVANRHS